MKIVYIYMIGLVLAVLEIQIEGAHGWAEKLPAWRPKDKWFVRVYQKLSGHKEFTGYHFFLNIFLLLFFHLPFIWMNYWTWQLELEILAFYMIFIVFWDFLWFVLNPHHSLNDFNKRNIWWHQHWWGKFPRDYYFGFLAAIIIYIPLILNDPIINIYKLLILIGGILVLTSLTVLIYPRAY